MGKREIAIENGIPCPGPKGPQGPRTPVTRACYKMKVGESILCETTTERDTARSTLRKLGGKVVAKKGADGEGWRVWRVA